MTTKGALTPIGGKNIIFRVKGVENQGELVLYSVLRLRDGLVIAALMA